MIENSLEIDASQLDREAMEAIKALCNSSLAVFVEEAWHIVEPQSEFIGNWHIDAICDELQRMTEFQMTEKELVINIPPGCGKSLLVNVFWPCWVWGPAQMPWARWFFASYSAELSTRDSLKRRDLMASPWYRKRWGGRFEVKQDQKAKTRYANTRGGEMIASSVGGAGLGEHPDYIVVDDPLKTNEANSQVERQSCLDWWDQTVSTRGHLRGSRRVIIMQRLHEADLSGHVIEKGECRHVCIPMRHDPDHPYPYERDPRNIPGELMWPQAINSEAANKLKRDLGPTVSAGQLQQLPTPAGGGQFKREYFRYCKDHGDYYELMEPSGPPRKVARADCWRFAVIDTAMTTRTESDYSVRQVWDVERGRSSDGQEVGRAMILVDQWRERVQNPEVEAEIRNTIIRWKPLFVGIEAVSDGMTIYQRFVRDGLPMKRLEYGKTKRIPDKITKAVVAEIWMSQGKMWFLDGADYLESLEHELLIFPNGLHDDAADALFMAAHVGSHRNLWAKPKQKTLADLPPTSSAKILGMDKIFEPQSNEKPAFSKGMGRYRR